MELKDCISFANANPICFLSTVDGDQPHVRTVRQMSADENGFIYVLLSPKQVSRQVKANPKVEVCYYNNAVELGEIRQMRVTGTAELIKDPALIKKAVQDRAGVADITGQPVEPIIEVWRISHGDAHFWGMMDILKEPQIEHITF